MTQEDALLGFAESLIFIVHGGSDGRDGGLGVEEAFGAAGVRIAWSSIFVLAPVVSSGFGADAQMIVALVIGVGFGGGFGLAS